MKEKSLERKCPRLFYGVMRVVLLRGCGAQKGGFSGFPDLAGLEHADGHPDTFGRSVVINDLDPFQIGLDHAQGLPDDLGTGAALAADHTASFIFTA